MSLDNFKGSIAVITGSSVGIGRQLCEDLLSESTDMVVAGFSRRGTSIDNVNFVDIKCDITDHASLDKAITDLVAKYPERKIKILINNAGCGKPVPLLSHPLLKYQSVENPEMNAEDAFNGFSAMSNLNIVALAMVTRICSKFMDHESVGNIVNISSISGHRVAPPANTHFYAATKYAVRALGEGLRHELRQIGSKIRVNSISPGFIETEFYEALSQNQEYLNSMQSMFKKENGCLNVTDISKVVFTCLSADPRVDIGDIVLRPTSQMS